MIRSALMTVMTNAAIKAGRGLKRDFGEIGQLQVSMKGPGDFVSLVSAVETALLAEELGRGLVLQPFAACGVLPARLLAKLGGQGRAGLLEAVSGGEAIAAAALSEPQARGALARSSSLAERISGGWRLAAEAVAAQQADPGRR